MTFGPECQALYVQWRYYFLPFLLIIIFLNPRCRKWERAVGQKRGGAISETAMASSSSSGLTFKLHPLVIVNISDHHTRVKSQMHPPINGSDGVGTTPTSSSSPSPMLPRVYGCVIGVQRGRTVEIFNSFELLYDASTHSLDRAFLEKKQELCSVSTTLPLPPFCFIITSSCCCCCSLCIIRSLPSLFFLLLPLPYFTCIHQIYSRIRFQIRRFSPTFTYLGGTPLEAMLRSQTCTSIKP